ncbi:MAG: universal stress protein [Verrucomicrobiae bacterium]|nr:universal stress protein [Verrucomicrobiae bacterium]
MKLLCGTDFSPNAAEAATTAALLAGRFGDDLILVHACAPPVDDGLTPDIWAPVEKALRGQLDAQAASLAAFAVPVETRLEPGHPVSVLERMVRPGRTRMIVLSSVGRVALARVLLGSTADRIAESAAAPTLVVRSTIPFREWADGKRPLRIFVATDGSAASDTALAFVRDWAAVGAVRVMLGYVAEASEDGTPKAIPGVAEAESTRQILERDLTERARLILGDTPFDVEVVLAPVGPPAVLIELAKEHRADLMVTGTHQRHGVRRLWHRSVSRALLSDSPMSVAVVPVESGGAPGPIPVLERVLVSTDLSPLGNRAIATACSLLPKGGTLRVVHALPAGGGRRSAPLSPGEHESRIRHLKSLLMRLVPCEAASKAILVQPVILEADQVAEALLAEALRFGAHAICLSSHGRSAAMSVLLGSVAQTVMRNSPVPVHLVPSPKA